MTGRNEKNWSVGIMIFISVLLCLPFLLKLLYALPVADSFLWYCGVFFVFYVPGNLLVRHFAFRNSDFFPRFVYSLALGTASMPLIYTVFRKLQLPGLTLYFVIGLFLLRVALFMKDYRKEKYMPFSNRDIFSFSLLLAFILLLLHFSYFTDIVLFEQGFKIRTSRFTETIFHLGIINNLRDLYPPLYPYASGNDLFSYHLNMHLEIEMFHRLIPIDTVRLTFFYFPFFYFFTLVFLIYVLVLEIGGNRVIAVATALLLFGSDLSFLSGAFGKVPWDYPWISFYNPLLWSLLTLNGILPAVILMFLSIFCLYQFDKSGKTSLLILFCLIGYSSFGFKSSMGFHLLGALFLTGIASLYIADEKKKGLLLCTAAVLTMTLMALDFFLFRGGPGGRGQKFAFDMFHAFRGSLTRVGIAHLPWFYYPLLFLGYTLSTFGARVFGFVFIKRAFNRVKFNLLHFFLIVFVISGFFLSEVISIGHPGSEKNNAMWFSSQSLLCAWLLVAYFLIGQIKHWKRLLAFVVITILFSMPSTVQFLTLRSHSAYANFNANALEVEGYLENTPPGAKVLHPLNEEPALASNFAGRVSVINSFRSFAHVCIGEEEYLRRIGDVKSFFSAESLVKKPLLLKQYDVDFVYAPVAYLPLLEEEAMLSQVMKNDEYVVYKVQRTRL